MPVKVQLLEAEKYCRLLRKARTEQAAEKIGETIWNTTTSYVDVEDKGYYLHIFADDSALLHVFDAGKAPNLIAFKHAGR